MMAKFCIWNTVLSSLWIIIRNKPSEAKTCLRYYLDLTPSFTLFSVRLLFLSLISWESSGGIQSQDIKCTLVALHCRTYLRLMPPITSASTNKENNAIALVLGCNTYIHITWNKFCTQQKVAFVDPPSCTFTFIYIFIPLWIQIVWKMSTPCELRISKFIIKIRYSYSFAKCQNVLHALCHDVHNQLGNYAICSPNLIATTTFH